MSIETVTMIFTSGGHLGDGLAQLLTFDEM
jgi:hypothetical protein